MIDALWASVLATFVLIIINAIYAWQNRQTVKEMEKARKAEYMPHLKAKLNWVAPTFLELEVTNFGKGPATNIKAEITFQPYEEKRPLEQSIMAPNESIQIFLPEGNTDKISEKLAKIIIKGEYSDIFG